MVGLFPAALGTSSDVVISHPSLTYGGLVVDHKLGGEAVIRAYMTIKNHLAAIGLKKMLIKLVPSIYYKKFYQDDSYAMFRLGANRYRCDISATIDLNTHGKSSKDRRYKGNKGQKSGVKVVEDITLLNDIYSMIQDNLKREHGVKPIHTLDELNLLHERFPDRIHAWAAKVDGEVIAGLIMFNHDKLVAHAQYIASFYSARKHGALDFLFESVVLKYQEEGFRYFDFGISNERKAFILNENLYRYKRSFGAGSVVREFFEINLGDE